MAVNSRKPFSMAASKRVWKAWPVIWNILQMKATVILSSHMKLIWIFLEFSAPVPFIKDLDWYILPEPRPLSGATRDHARHRREWSGKKIRSPDIMRPTTQQRVVTIYYETNPPAGWAHQKSVNRAPSASGRFPSGELAPQQVLLTGVRPAQPPGPG